jgi:hypothetical protein
MGRVSINGGVGVNNCTGVRLRLFYGLSVKQP